MVAELVRRGEFSSTDFLRIQLRLWFSGFWWELAEHCVEVDERLVHHLLAGADLHRRHGGVAAVAPFAGSFAVRILTLVAHDGERIRFDQSLLETPVEAVAVLCRSAAGRREGGETDASA